MIYATDLEWHRDPHLVCETHIANAGPVMLLVTFWSKGWSWTVQLHEQRLCGDWVDVAGADISSLEEGKAAAVHGWHEWVRGLAEGAGFEVKEFPE